MRIKISFIRDQVSSNSIPLHHQISIYRSLKDFITRLPDTKTFVNYSSLKGTSSVQNGYIRFLSSKITLVISSNNDEYANWIVNAIFEQPSIQIGKLNLIPKYHHVVPEPEYKTQMKYVCISPLLLIDPDRNPERAEEQIEPTSQEFSDILYDSLIERMELAGYSEEELTQFEVFEAIPDASYLAKIAEGNKKFARIYKNLEGKLVLGYLLPFSLHAHPKVHQFVWNAGIGVLTDYGYGMIDVVPEPSTLT